MKEKIVNLYCPAILLALGLAVSATGQNASSQIPKTTSEAKAGGETKPQAKGPVADNSRCFVCHINFEEEELAATHARANLGCVKCHGESAAHSADEDNVTAPDVMFPKSKINAACLKCHAKEKLSETHKSVLAGQDPKFKYCTDCHGEHRINYRTRQWDKETRKLIPKKATSKSGGS